MRKRRMCSQVAVAAETRMSADDARTRLRALASILLVMMVITIKSSIF